MVGQPVGASSAQEKEKPIYIAAMGPSEIYFQVFKRILEEADIPVTYIHQNYGNLRERFITGAFDMSCCASPQWRTRPQEEAVQLFSRPFFYVIDSYAVSRTVADKGFNPTNPDLVFARVKGWDYARDIHASKDVVADNSSEALALVHQGKADYTIINRQDFFNKTLKMKYNVVLTGVYSRMPIHIRFHKRNSHLVAPVDEAIKRLRKKLEISRIVAQSIRPQPIDKQ